MDSRNSIILLQLLFNLKRGLRGKNMTRCVFFYPVILVYILVCLINYDIFSSSSSSTSDGQ